MVAAALVCDGAKSPVPAIAEFYNQIGGFLLLASGGSRVGVQAPYTCSAHMHLLAISMENTARA